MENGITEMGQTVLRGIRREKQSAASPGDETMVAGPGLPQTPDKASQHVDLRKLRRVDLLELLVDHIRENERQEATIEELTAYIERLEAKLDQKEEQIDRLRYNLDMKDAIIVRIASANLLPESAATHDESQVLKADSVAAAFQVEAPEAQTSEHKTPETKAAEPTAAEVKAPEVKTVGSSTSRFKLPRLRLSKLRAPKGKEPAEKAPVEKAPELKAPSAAIPQIVLPEIDLPKANADALPTADAPMVSAAALPEIDVPKVRASTLPAIEVPPVNVAPDNLQAAEETLPLGVLSIDDIPVPKLSNYLTGIESHNLDAALFQDSSTASEMDNDNVG